jgi:hypothetical protein
MQQCQDCHIACQRCQKVFSKQLIYRYAARYYVGALDGVPQIVEFDYRVCTDCLFELISRRYKKQEKTNNG